MTITELKLVRDDVLVIIANMDTSSWQFDFLTTALFALDEKIRLQAKTVQLLESCLSRNLID